MTRQIRSAVFRYTAAIAANAAVVGINYLLGLREHFSSALFLAAFAACAWYGGLGPGLMATVVAAVTLDYFFVGQSFALDFGSATWMWLFIFVAVAVFLNLLQESQRRMAAEAKREADRKHRFVTVLAHELRNFLSPAASAVAVLEANGAKDSTTAAMCAVIDRQLHNMTSLVNDLLDAGRISQGKLSLNIEVIDLRDAVTDAIGSARPLLEERGHTLELQMGSAPLWLPADRTRLEQVLLNLLTNAAKYTEPGGKLSVVARREANQIVVHVKDSGKGIAPELLPRIFDLFVQADPGTNTGLGVGLNLVRGMVEQHGGTVAAFSDGLGCGSEFVVRLPAAEIRAAADTMAAGMALQPARAATIEAQH